MFSCSVYTIDRSTNGTAPNDPWGWYSGSLFAPVCVKSNVPLPAELICQEHASPQRAGVCENGHLIEQFLLRTLWPDSVGKRLVRTRKSGGVAAEVGLYRSVLASRFKVASHIAVIVSCE